MIIRPVTASAVFCEDIREELSGAHSLVGIMPDNIAVPSFPGAMPKICVYARTLFDIERPPRTASVIFSRDETETLAEIELDDQMMSQAVRDAKKYGSPVGAVVTKIQAGNFLFDGPCRLLVIQTWDDEQFLIGAVRVHTVEAAKAMDANIQP